MRRASFSGARPVAFSIRLPGGLWPQSRGCLTATAHDRKRKRNAPAAGLSLSPALQAGEIAGAARGVAIALRGGQPRRAGAQLRLVHGWELPACGGGGG